ncbi:hypothetical protein KAR91_09245 [Candidatus Pacearchaeota archaeon]|nr:hypothetical protein [Candidatus Pacearchaeota archaeon]
MGTTNRQFNPSLHKAHMMHTAAIQKRTFISSRNKEQVSDAPDISFTGRVAAYFTKIYQSIRSLFGRKGAQRSSHPSLNPRQFFYTGVDGQKHKVRQGSIFKVRPKEMPFAVIATPDNRMILSI